MHPETRRDGTIPARLRLVWQLVSDALAHSGMDAPNVLDCGGGSGSFAVPLARTGAHVTVVDISVDALATLQRRAIEAGVADQVRPVQADVEALGDAVAPAAFDLALAHGILEEVDDLNAAIAAIGATIRPGGLLSIVIGNPAAAVLARALSGDLTGALEDVHGLDALQAKSGPAAVQAACVAHGLVIEQVHGIGVFSELVPGAALDQPGAGDALAELESLTASRTPFTDIAARVHLLARRSG